MANTTQVCYKYKVIGSENTKTDLKEYHATANRAASIFTEFFLNLFGGMGSDNLKHSRYNLEKKKTKKKGEKVNGHFPLAVTLFANWFSYEDLEGVDTRLVINKEDVFAKFLAYLNSEGITATLSPEWADVIERSILSPSADDLKTRTWVDRRRGHDLLIEKFGLSRSAVNWLIDNPSFPMQESPIPPDSIEFTRSLFSMIWGGGEQSDWSSKVSIITQLQKITNLSITELKDACCKTLGIPANTPANIISSKFMKAKGSPSALCRFLAGERDEAIANEKFTIEHFTKMLDGELAKGQLRTAMVKEAAHDKIITDLGNQIGLPFTGPKKNNLEFYCEWSSKAIERIRANRKGFLNQLKERHDYIQSLAAKKASISSFGLIHNFVTNWFRQRAEQNTEQPEEQKFLSDLDIGGLWQAKEHYTASYLAAATAAEKNSRNHRANFAFLKEIATFFDQQNDKTDWFKALEQYQNWSETNYKAETLRCPTLARFTNKPDHPTFGKSRPTGKLLDKEICKLVNNEKVTVYHARLQIVNHGAEKFLEVPIVNKRATHDLDRTGTEDAPRRTKLYSLLTEKPIHELKAKAVQKGVKLVVRPNGNVYLYMTYELETHKIPKLAEVSKQLKNGTYQFPVLSCDPGIREAISYALSESIRVSPKQTKSFLDEKPYLKIGGVWFRVNERDSLRETDYRRNGKLTTCRLKGNLKKEVNEAGQELWQSLANFKELNLKGECPTTVYSLIRNAAGAIKSYARRVPKDNKPNIVPLRQLTEFLREHTENTGGLSYERILSIRLLKTLYQLYAKRLDIKKNPIPWIEESLNYCIDKYRNLREERVRRTVNLIATKSLENKVRLVLIENTCLDIHSPTSKALMRKIDIWTPRRVLELLRQQLNPLGIMVYMTPSEYSSHTDFSDHNIKMARYDDMTAQQAVEEVDYYSKIKNPRGETTKLYKNAIENELKKLGLGWETDPHELRNRLPERLRFPRRGGKWIHTKLLGWINADENASMVFLGRAMERILAKKEES